MSDAGEQASALVRRMLDECVALTRAGFERYLSPMYPTLSFYRMLSDYPARGGRNMRACLCIAAARAFGASMHQATNTAVALEILHNAFLVHDDVEDESEERRGRPTMHRMHGVPAAVNVGDALAVLSLQPLIENRGTLGPLLALRVLEEAQRMARESVEGQAIELGWRADNASGLTIEDYLRMILKKTCWYTTIYPIRVGALIGTRDGVDLDRYLRFGFLLGAAFQIQDDLLNLTGARNLYGKEIGGDIHEGKRTLMLVHLLQHAGAGESARILHLLSLPRADKPRAEIAWVRGLMDHYGSIQFAREIAHGLAGAALHEYDLAFAELQDSEDKRFLAAMPRWVLERS